MIDTQVPPRYTVIGVQAGDVVGWRVARLSDLAVAGYDSTHLRMPGMAYVEDPIVPRTFEDYEEAQFFLDQMEAPGFNPVVPVVWVTP